MMKSFFYCGLVVVLLQLTGCTKTESGFAGAGLGTAAGAGIGYAIDGGAGGAILGGVLGGLGGAAIGSMTNKEGENQGAQSAPSQAPASGDPHLRQQIRQEQYNLEQERIDLRRQELENKRLEIEKKRLELEEKKLQLQLNQH